ncbi:MAG: hypothetical protein UW69_C0086G0001, partial [Microgenomates group bacterium GW2011_GWA2_44_7]
MGTWINLLLLSYANCPKGYCLKVIHDILEPWSPTQVQDQLKRQPPHPFSTEILKLLDFRDTKGGEKNVSLSKEFIAAWRDYVAHSIPLLIQELRVTSLRPQIGVIFQGYLEYLNRLISSGNEVALREVLRTSGSQAHSPLWTMFFGEFMKAIGVDGVIYFERGEQGFKVIDSTVAIYNVEKAGTAADWKKRENKVT